MLINILGALRGPLNIHQDAGGQRTGLQNFRTKCFIVMVLMVKQVRAFPFVPGLLCEKKGN